MGMELLTFCRDKIKSTWKLAFGSAFIIGLLVHIYKFTNLLPNYDALYNFYSTQNMVASGRWFLSIACMLSSYFDLPWVIGILSLVFMGITAAMIAEVFRMENPVLIVLSSSLLVSFPAITATMAYEFTADGYMMAMTLAAFSVCLTRMEYVGKKHFGKWIASAVCICLACGIYQAYVSFAFVLAVCCFIVELLENKYEQKQYWGWICAQILTYAGALAAYFIIWKLCLNIQGFAASSYQGIDNVGAMGIGDLIAAVLKIVRDFIRFFLEWNILDHGITVFSGLNLLFLVCFAAGILLAILKSGMRKLPLLMLAVCICALPVGCFIWYLTSPDVVYHVLMLQSVSLLYILAVVLFDRWICPRWSNLVMALMVAITLNNAVSANMFYNYMHQCFEKTHAAAVELVTRIHLLDDGEVKYVAILGGLDGWSQEDHFRQDKLRQLGGLKLLNKTILSPMFLELYTDFDLSYYRSQNIEYPVMELEINAAAPQNWEFRFPMQGVEERNKLEQSETVLNMPVWPARDSVQVIGDTIVVKLSETEIMDVSE